MWSSYAVDRTEEMEELAMMEELADWDSKERRCWRLFGILDRRGGCTDSADLEGKSKSFAWNSEERGASCFCFATAH